jgi:hypothetical protein
MIFSRGVSAVRAAAAVFRRGLDFRDGLRAMAGFLSMAGVLGNICLRRIKPYGASNEAKWLRFDRSMAAD